MQKGTKHYIWVICIFDKTIICVWLYVAVFDMQVLSAPSEL